eukprot:Gb_29272 [translate_table: standard]
MRVPTKSGNLLSLGVCMTVFSRWIPFRIAKPLLDRTPYVCLSNFIGYAEAISNSANNEAHESSVQDDYEMEDAFETRDGGLVEYENSGSSDDSVGLEGSAEVSGGDLASEDISGVLIQLNGLRFRFKDLQTFRFMDQRHLDTLAVHLRKYVKVVGTELSGRIAYSLG